MTKTEYPKLRVLTGTFCVPYDAWLPYASGSIISYSKKKLGQEKYDFWEPLYKPLPRSELRKIFLKTDVLGLTCYVWNESINSNYSNFFKLINPDGIIIWGGPNVPKDYDAFSNFSKKHPVVDSFVIGSGEVIFAELLKDAYNKLILKQNVLVPKKSFASKELLPDQGFSNPYLDGTFDKILEREKNIKASFETNRGCPYSCSFCDWGGQSQSKITPISEEIVNRTIDFLFSCVNLKEIEILDANFGMFARDLKFIEQMIQAKNKHGTNPKISYSGLAKNGSKYLSPILGLLYKNFNINDRHLKISFQTHSENVLKIAGRENIKNEKLLKILDIGKQHSIDVCSEMIIGLPGETSKSWADSLAKDILLGINFTRTYILSVSDNTRLASKEYAQTYSIKYKNVYFPDYRHSSNAGSIEDADEKNQHRVVYSCHSFDNLELKKMYRYWWFHHTFYNAKLFPKTISLILKKGMSYSVFIDAFLKYIESIPKIFDLVSKVDNFVEIYFRPEPETFIDNFEIYRFSCGAMRFSDVLHLWEFQDDTKSYLHSFFKKMFKQDDEIINSLLSELAQWMPSVERTDTSRLVGLEANIRNKHVARNI